MISRRTLIAGAAASAAVAALPAAAIAAVPPQVAALPPYPVGMIRQFFTRPLTVFYPDTIQDVDLPPIEERIFDGEAWIPLHSEAGWKLYINQQYKDDPYALE